MSLLAGTALTGTAIAAGILGDGTSSIPTSQFHGKSNAEIRSLLEAHGMGDCSSPEVVSGLSDLPAKFMGVYFAGCGPASSEAPSGDEPGNEHESPQPIEPTEVAPTKVMPERASDLALHKKGPGRSQGSGLLP